MGPVELAMRRGIKLSPEQSEKLKRYERGTKLLSLIELPGWDLVQRLIGEEVELAQHRLVSSTETDPNKIAALHHRYHAMKDMQQSILYAVNSLVEEGKNPPDLLDKHNLH